MKTCSTHGCEKADGHGGAHASWDAQAMSYIPIAVQRVKPISAESRALSAAHAHADRHTYTVRHRDMKHALKVLNSHNLSASNGELREALKALVGFALPIREGSTEK